MPLNLSNDCDVYGKKFLVPHDLPFPKKGLVIAQNTDAAKEWGALSVWALNPSCIPMNQKSTVGPYRDRGTGLDSG